jgi:hypothetical protein
MVRNPLYGGRVVHAGWGIEAEAAFQPIVPRETFLRAQRVLAGLQRVPGPPVSRKFDHPDSHSAASIAVAPAARN